MSAKFIKYDPTMTAPAFSDDAEIEIKTRDGRVMQADEPWSIVGWNHTGGPNDIMEYRLLIGSMTKQKPVRDRCAEVDEIARRRGLPVMVNRDPNVELRALLKEVIDVLHCHHRNTHKPLLERVRAYRSQL